MNEGHKIKLVPWDLDMTWGYDWSGEYPTLLYEENETIYKIDGLLTNSDNINNSLKKRYFELRETVLSVDNVFVENSTIEGIGNERIEVYVGGIMGGVCWENNNNPTTISNSYVYDSVVSAKANYSTYNNKTKAHAGGIMGYSTGVVVNFNYNAVMNTDIIADCNSSDSGKEIAAGILSYVGSADNTILNGNYSNAVLVSDENTRKKLIFCLV